MATELQRKRFLSVYREMRDPDMFLSGFFEVRAENISDTEKVAIDIERTDEEISPIVNTCEGPTINSSSLFTTKEFTPPSIEEAMAFDCKELLNREAGTNEYAATDVGFQSQLVGRIMRGMNKLENKVRRNREWQASQILQTGTLTLVDQDGNDAYIIDYQPKATHFIESGIDWSNTSSDPLQDIQGLSDVIRDDSLQDADQLIMGETAVNNFISNPIVQAQLDNRRIAVGNIAPEMRGAGGKFWGFINIGNYEYQIWSFNGRGLVPGSSTKIRFVNATNVIVRASSGRLDTVFAGVPRAVPIDPRFAGFLPDRVAVPRAVDLMPNIWSTPDGLQTMLAVYSRPLLIPTSIDSFGTIDTTGP